MTRPLHVVHVIDSLARSGGSERQLLVNLHHFSNPQLRHSLIAVRPGLASRLGEVPPNIASTVLFGNEEAPSRLSLARQLMKGLTADRADLIHCSLPNASYACRLVGPLLRVPVVESLVNISHEPIRAVDNPNVSVCKLRAHAALDRLTMRHFAGYHAVGPTVADSWNRTTGLRMDKMVVIPRGLPPDLPLEVGPDPQGRIRRDLELKDQAFVLLSVGRQEPQKGHRYAIEAMPRILREIPEAHLLIAGREGISTEGLRRLVQELELASRVRFLGSRSDVLALMRSADVFLFPSLFEGNGGNALIEAMATGCPVVVSKAPPMTEIAASDRVAMRVPTRNPPAIADAVVRLHEDPDLRRTLAANARIALRSRPSALEVAEAMERWYLDLLSPV